MVAAQQLDLFRADGESFDPTHDAARLGAQYSRVYEVVSDRCWWTPDELERVTGYRWSSINARLRDMRKSRFGNHVVERQRLTGGQHRYRFIR